MSQVPRSREPARERTFGLASGGAPSAAAARAAVGRGAPSGQHERRAGSRPANRTMPPHGAPRCAGRLMRARPLTWALLSRPQLSAKELEWLALPTVARHNCEKMALWGFRMPERLR